MAEPLGSAPGIIVGVGVGAAASTALEAAVELPRQKVWADNPNKLLDPALVARLVAQGAVKLGEGRADALREGYTSEKFDQLVYLSQTVPAVAEALSLWLRGHIGDGLMGHVLVKAGMDTRYVQPILDAATDTRLNPAQIALSIVRSLLASQGLLVGENDVRGGVIAPTPVSPIDAVAEAETWGVDEERLRVMVNSIGLPMALQAAASATFRGIIDKPDFYLAVAQGDTRPAWADAIYEQARQILTASQYVEGHLRGWISEPEMYAGTAKHGMSAADTDLLFKVSGRPITIHQITTGLARGGTYPSTYDDVPEPYRKSLEEGNIRPEWASLDYANRYSLPSAFVIRALLTGGAITAAQGEQLFLESGWPPALAKQVAGFYGTTTTAAVDPWVKRAETQLWTTIHNSYRDGLSDGAEARNDLALLGVTGDAANRVLDLWTAERDTWRKQLTPAQIKKAWSHAENNPATGAPWTRDEAIERLLALGYNSNDAETFLGQ